MTNVVDKSYFSQLAHADPEILCRKKCCSYDADTGKYSVIAWGDHFLIDCTHAKIDIVSTTSRQPHEYFDLFVMYYLLQDKDIPLTGEWISEKDLPGGSTFFRGPHLIPTELISRRFGNDLEAFCAWSRQLGGTPVELGDAAFRFEITEDIPVVVLYWAGDEDFPAETKILYDRSIAELLSLDILYALAVSVCDRLGKDKQPISAWQVS